MINEFNDKIAVLGIGTEGKDVVNYLLQRNYKNITVFDKKYKKDLDLENINSSKISFITGPDYLKKGLINYKTIFRSPGVYRYLPEIIEAESMGSVITSNIKLFFEKHKGVTIGVTGTKGKGTTSTLIYKILRQKSRNVYLAGNIGNPPLELLNNLNEKSIVVLELSSFQLIDLTKSPNISVVLNITTDHMDWHRDQNEYLDAKKNIVRFQDKNDSKVLNNDYASSKAFKLLSASNNLYISKYDKVKGVYVKDGIIYANISDENIKIGETKNLLLRGVHNWENVCAAICASLLAGASVENARKAVFSFKGLEHRLELVAKVSGVEYYNDSFSTNPQTTSAAVDSFSEPITLILGGYDKGLDFEGMVKNICCKINIPSVVLIGDVSAKLIRLLKTYKFRGEIYRLNKSKMESVVKKCADVSQKGGVVLLSPACASFDMFKNYKDRGDQFKKAVYDLMK